MRRTSKYYPLAFVVECKSISGPGWWETIAAFNHDGIAFGYAEDCAKANSTIYEYRVMRRTGKGWIESKEPGKITVRR